MELRSFTNFRSVGGSEAASADVHEVREGGVGTTDAR